MSCVFNSARSRIWLIWTAVGPDTKTGLCLAIGSRGFRRHHQAVLCERVLEWMRRRRCTAG